MQREGFLHVLRLGDGLNGEGRYSITFAPYDRGGGALPAREARSPSELREFLSEIGCDGTTIERVVSELQANRRTSMPNVVLSDEQLKRYGLREMGVLQSVLSYLSS
ncbi:MAG: hypothetical protein DMD91_30405 [Candidatus Rokuibacteriota bacterium]|nr:MAG: hypothetical protein DMD91_30405 [Candidatus Rokubacteria bacterium]